MMCVCFVLFLLCFVFGLNFPEMKVSVLSGIADSPSELYPVLFKQMRFVPILCNLYIHTILSKKIKLLSPAQPAGQPEVCKTSMDRCSVKGGQEMFIIGRNFPKNSKVIFQEWHNDSIVWQEEANLDKEHFNSVSVCVCACACVRVPRRMVLVLFFDSYYFDFKKNL